MQYKKSRQYLSATLIFAASLLFAATIQAAELSLETEVAEVGVGQEMEVRLWLDTEGETINALEGILTVPPFISIGSIRDASSLIELWIDRPQVEETNSVTFAGIIPNGWGGSRGNIFSAIVKTNSEGQGTLNLSDFRVLLNDGLGTAVETSSSPLSIVADESIELQDLVSDIVDQDPPEAFTPILLQDPTIFGGEYALVFSAQDALSGIDRYEVVELGPGQTLQEGVWQVTESPYHIKDQSLESSIYVRAIDKAGNARVEIFKPPLFDVRIAPAEPTEVPLQTIVVALLVILIPIIIGLSVYLFVRARSKKQ